MKKDFVIISLVFFVCAFYSCNNSKKNSQNNNNDSTNTVVDKTQTEQGSKVITEEKAKHTIDMLLAQGKKVPGNDMAASLKQVLGLFKISENEYNAKAILINNSNINRNEELRGKFIFHKNTNNEWVLDKLEFSNASGTDIWNAEVYQKVE